MDIDLSLAILKEILTNKLTKNEFIICFKIIKII
jgi:hypothetical protein